MSASAAHARLGDGASSSGVGCSRESRERETEGGVECEKRMREEKGKGIRNRKKWAWAD